MNILLTSAGRRTYLIDYFKNAIGNKGMVYASNSQYTYSLSHADNYVITPNIYDEGYIEFLVDFCKAHQINAIISLFDIDLPILAAKKEKFKENGITVIVSDSEVIDICNDKWKTYCFLKENNINTPRTYLHQEEIIEEIAEGNIAYPVIIKPRWGMGSIGIYQAGDEQELQVLSQKLRREIFNTYLKYESSADIDDCILYQEKINGDEFGIDVFNDFKGKLVAIVAKKKIAMRAGETDIAETVSAVPFENIAIKLSTKLGHIANLDVDCFMTENGYIYVLELNCRFGGQYPFSHLAGVDFPKQIIEWLNGRTTEKSLTTAKIGIRGCKDLTPVSMNDNIEC